MQTALVRRIADVLRHRSPAAWATVRSATNHYYSWRPGARRRTFARIHASNHWGDSESLSGGGSTLTETEAVRRALPELFRRHGIRSLLDVPCGDFNWMQHVAPAVDEYIGADIVPALVADVSARHAAPGRRFLVLDLVTDDLPRADAVLARDVLIHLSQRDVRAALTNIRRSGAQWLLTTTYPEHVNRDIITGDWRPLNLQAAPYLLPPPIELIPEETQERQFSDRSLGLWSVASLPDHL